MKTKYSECCNAKTYFNHATGDYCCSICTDPVILPKFKVKERMKVLEEMLVKTIKEVDKLKEEKNDN